VHAYKDKQHNVTFFRLKAIFEKILDQISDLELSSLKKTDQKKLLLHFFICNLLEIKSRSRNSSRMVFFLYKEDLFYLTRAIDTDIFTSVIKRIKSKVPVPFLILDNDIFDVNLTGELKGVLEKISNYFIKRSCNAVSLKKYLMREGFQDLIKTLDAPKNINTLIN
jgi:hypothetical protein